MKHIIKYLLTLLLLAPIFVACETDSEPVRIQYPDEQSPFLRDKAYYARLRAYKESDHSLAFGWFGSWTAIGASEQTRLTSTPDSMDIISMWSQWHSLTEQQMADKAEIQQLRGTRVVYCISARDIDERFKENGQITEASLVAYAKAYAKDSMDKYQYDGIDIDFETAADHRGPLNNTPGLFKRLCEELSQYIGPKSGTGRLFIIDGNIEALDEGIAPLCNYGVSQAYNCSGVSNLEARTRSFVNAGWREEQLIFTENFESLWKTGGVDFSGPAGEVVPSLLGMAEYARDNTAVGFGAYHMEYEYGHSDMPYKYMRQAIQLANPAPSGDYSKNLLSLNEAGEMRVDVTVLPSGATAGVETTLSGHLAAVAATDVDIALTVDNTLVDSYNDYYYTEYGKIDPSLVSFSGPLHFAAGEQESAGSVRVAVADFTGLPDGEYLLPIRADFTKTPAYSANTLKQYLYLIATKCTKSISVAFTDADYAAQLEFSNMGGQISGTPEVDLTLDLDGKAPGNVSFSAAVDQSLVEAYNAAHGTGYAAVDASNVTIGGTFDVAQGGERSSAVTVSLKDPSLITTAKSLIALRLAAPTSKDYTLAEEGDVKYIVVVRNSDNIDQSEGTLAIETSPYGDTSGWSFRLYQGTNTSGASGSWIYNNAGGNVDGADEQSVINALSAGLFTNSGAFWYVMPYDYSWNKTGNFIVDMGKIQQVFRMRWGVYYQITNIAITLYLSDDGQTWSAMNTDPISPIQLWSSYYDITLREPVEARYIRVVVSDYDSWVSMRHFEVHKR